MDGQRDSSQLWVDLAQDTGALKYGASGFLYGLGNAGIPNVAILAPLKPQVAAQKPEGGLQHPNGDALDVAGTYQAAGGKEIEIYLQDAYPGWPYDQMGLADYLDKVEAMVRQVSASPHASLFSYVPFNEPDQIWYNKTDKKVAFFTDWQSVYQKIKAIHSSARIVGPNFARYDAPFYRDFMAFAKAHACLPDVVSWHELNQDFFTGWAGRYADYRSIEAALGLAAREICINEYGRIKGDLGIPGKLVQWIARFEESKVDACLAYWTDAGSLNNLVTRDHYNKATGGWWLYRCYAGMTGHTVKVTPPDPQAEGLQGLAALDRAKSQVRILFGGAAGPVRLVVDGFTAVPTFAGRVHAALWAIESSGLNPSTGPTLVMEDDYPIIAGLITLDIKDAVETSAYQIILSPSGVQGAAGKSQYYAAAYADLSGGARTGYADQDAWVEGYGQGDNVRTSFVVTAMDNGFYKIRLGYSAGPLGGSTGPRGLRMVLNGTGLTDLILPATESWEAWAQVDSSIFLAAGINRIAFEPSPVGGRGVVHIRDITVTPAVGPVWSYKAADPANALSGTAAILVDPAASGGRCVSYIGDGPANALEFKQIAVPHNATYRMVVHFSNAEFRGGHSYNSQVVDRFAEISVNENKAQKVFFRNTFAWDNYQTRLVDIELNAGLNTIKFSNSASGCFAPNLDKIKIAPPLIVVPTEVAG
jgi:hypothetical protein